MNKSSILITRPDHDVTTRYLCEWAKNVIAEAEKRGFSIYDLKGKKANKEKFEGIIAKTEPEVIFINGHGDSDCLSGYDNEVLVKAGENESLFAEKIIYALSCRSASELGRCSVKSGAIAYLGYMDDFVFLIEQDKVGHPLKDCTASLFLDPSNLLAISLIKGHSPQESFRRAQEAQKKTIRKLLTSESAKSSSGLLPFLYWNMNNQVCLEK